MKKNKKWRMKKQPHLIKIAWWFRKTYNHVHNTLRLWVQQIFFSPQVKRSVIISNKLVYTSCLTCRWTNWDLKKLGNIRKISKIHRVIARCLVLMLSALFHMKTTLCLRFFLWMIVDLDRAKKKNLKFKS